MSIAGTPPTLKGSRSGQSQSQCIPILLFHADRVRSPSPKILSTGTVPKTYTRDSDLTKASSTITLGPFHNLPATLGNGKIADQSPFHVHYESTTPVMGYKSLKRSAEVSHWGNNMNFQDEIDLVNNGPK